MAINTFGDPQFAELVRRLDLEPVRISYTSRDPLKFQQLLEKFGVAAIPALVVVTKDGRSLPAVSGEMNAADIEYSISQSARRAQKGIYWSDPASTLLKTTARPVIRSFNKWFLVDTSLPRDWRWSTNKAFVTWANQNFEFVDDAFKSRVEGAGYYRQFKIHALPTLIVSLPGGGEIARFEGPTEVRGAPQKIVEILARRGITLEAPPAER